MMATRIDRRTRRPHYKQSAERDYVLASICNFLVGAMLGASVAIGVLG